MANLTLLMPALKHWTENLHISFIFRCLNVADLELVFSSFLLVKLASIEEMLGKKTAFRLEVTPVTLLFICFLTSTLSVNVINRVISPPGGVLGECIACAPICQASKCASTGSESFISSSPAE